MPRSTVHGGVTNEALEQSHRTGQPPEEIQGEHGPELDPELWGDKEPGPARPAVNDPKERWIEYALARGWSDQDAHAATKADLIEKTKDA